MKGNFKIIIFYIVLIVGILIVTTTLLEDATTVKITYSDVVDFFHSNQVKSFVVDEDNYITVVLTDEGKEVANEFGIINGTFSYQLRSLDLFYYDVGQYITSPNEAEKIGSNIESYNYVVPQATPWWLSFLPYVIIIVVFIVLWMYMMNQATGGKGSKINAFGRAKARLGSDEKKKVYFKDVAGADEEKEELREVVEFLKNPAKYLELGAKIPRGVLLVGPPGTGKTLLAKAVAGEAGVPFYSISGSDFVEMYVGVGASRVRDLFETAKKNSPSIVFIDEIDAVGRHRGAGLGGGHDEREQTLNQLLVEMDGFGSNDGVIIMAATNRPDILDPALLRPGRFDRQITVNYPDIKGREEILKVHAKDKPLEGDVNLSVLAKTTAGFTGADLANLLNEAALLAARKGKKLIGNTELEEATIKVIVGPQKKSKVVTEKERKLTAYHEAGHAIVTKRLKTQDPVHQISIIPSGRAGGYTLSLPSEDKSYMSKVEMEEEIVSLLGGRTAEKLVLGDISTGASNDIQRASQLARNMIMQYGMSEKLGPIVYGTGHTEVFLGKEFSNARNYSEKIAAMIDDETMEIISHAYTKAEKILVEDIEKLHFVAGFLVKNEIMDAEQFEAAISMEDVTEEDLLQIKDEKTKKSKEENRLQQEENERLAKELAKKLNESNESDQDA
ncbi:MAG TPA: hypothetical protein DER23_05895 [Clostridiales bacterium]|jgi:cell division protease FtsH|nr:hypothetical protein [Clostridiales bacterium]